jgi:ABC-type glycerol-3-phosphate transport system permease component
LFKPWKRRDLIHSAWKSIGTVFVMAISIDAAYQFIELHWFYPGEALITAVILACVPYVLICGPVSRIMSGRTRGETISGAQHEPIQQERIAR